MTSATLDPSPTPAESIDANVGATTVSAPQIAAAAATGTNVPAVKATLAQTLGTDVADIASAGTTAGQILGTVAPDAIAASSGSVTGIVGAVVDLASNFSTLRTLFLALLHDVEQLKL